MIANEKINSFETGKNFKGPVACSKQIHNTDPLQGRVCFQATGSSVSKQPQLSAPSEYASAVEKGPSRSQLPEAGILWLSRVGVKDWPSLPKDGRLWWAAFALEVLTGLADSPVFALFSVLDHFILGRSAATYVIRTLNRPGGEVCMWGTESFHQQPMPICRHLTESPWKQILYLCQAFRWL